MARVTEFGTTLRVHGRSVELVLFGELDSYTAPWFRARLDDALREHPHLTVDFAAVEFMDSSGLGALISAVRGARASGGDLRVRGASPKIMKIFRITGADRVLDVDAT